MELNGFYTAWVSWPQICSLIIRYTLDWTFQLNCILCTRPSYCTYYIKYENIDLRIPSWERVTFTVRMSCTHESIYMTHSYKCCAYGDEKSDTVSATSDYFRWCTCAVSEYHPQKMPFSSSPFHAVSFPPSNVKRKPSAFGEDFHSFKALDFLTSWKGTSILQAFFVFCFVQRVKEVKNNNFKLKVLFLNALLILHQS